MTILQGYLYTDVAQGGTVTISYPAGFAPDAYDQAGAMACMLSVDSSMPVGSYSLAWGGSSVVVTNNKGVWKAGVSLFIVVPDVIFSPSSGGVAATITGSYVVGQVLTVVMGPGLTGGTYQWTRDGSNISGATSSTYTLVTADAGKAVTCVLGGVTYTATGGSVPAGAVGGIPENSFAEQLLGGERPALSAKTALLIEDAEGYAAGAGTVSYNTYGVSAHKIPAGYDGAVETKLTTSIEAGSIIALDQNATLQAHTAADAYCFLNASTNILYNGTNAGALSTSLVMVPAAGMKARLRASASSILVEVSNSDGNCWRTKTTYSRPAGVDLYAHVYTPLDKRLSGTLAYTRPAKTGVNIVCDGNSLTSGQVSGADFIYNGGWPKLLLDMPQLQGATMQNLGVAGQTTAMMMADAASQVYPALTGAKNILIALEVRNSINQAGNARSAVDQYWSYLDGVRAYCTANSIDCTIVAVSPFDSDITNFGASPAAVSTFGDSAAAFSAKLATAAGYVRAEWAAHADVLVDLAAIAEFSPINSSVSYDGTHLWYSAGYARIRDAVYSVIAPFLS